MPDIRDDLIRAAIEAQERAYAPYSGYKVGAAILDDQSRTHSGCNVENASYGASICAERAAIVQMVAGGGKYVQAIAVVTKDGGTPCGICLQVLAEFAPEPTDVEIVCVATDGSQKTFKLSELLPVPFRTDELPRTP